MTYRQKFVLILCISYVQYVCGFFTPVIEIDQGKLRGLKGFSGQIRYYSIPYATSERFQAPEPPKKWSGVYHALSRFDSCAQSVGIFKLGNEDCHRLDVFTPEHATMGQRLPVMVFFHGGAYYYGSKFLYDPELLVKKNVIVVTVNYRLNALGFLCLNNVANLGLKDQQAALQWVQQNIAAFGGDPDNVAIAGQSAGSSAAGMHVLSKRSKGLFHKAILMSGVPLTPWAFNPESVTAALQDAAKMAKVRDELDVYNTFLNSSVRDLLTATRGTSINPRYFKYSPCVDANFTDPFFHDTPYNIIASGDFNKVPMIIGYTDMEGGLFYGLNDHVALEKLDNNFVDHLPSVFSWCSANDKMRITKKIRSHYFGKQKMYSRAAMKGVVDFYSDWIAYAGIDAFSKLMAKHSEEPVYNYMFSYEGQRNFASELLCRRLGLGGATHVDDLFYIFKPLSLDLFSSTSDKLIIERQTTMLTNFMKYGDPTPHTTALLPVRWPATTANRSQVLHIDLQLKVTDTPESQQGQFLLSMLCEYGLKGYVPCESAMKCDVDS